MGVSHVMASGLCTELRCAYIFTDADYGRNLDRDPTKAFEPSLNVWATVMSRSTEGRAIVDAGAFPRAEGVPENYCRPATPPSRRNYYQSRRPTLLCRARKAPSFANLCW